MFNKFLFSRQWLVSIETPSNVSLDNLSTTARAAFQLQMIEKTNVASKSDQYNMKLINEALSANKSIKQSYIDGDIINNMLKMPDLICKERLERYYKVTNIKTLPRTTDCAKEALLKPNSYYRRIKKILQERACSNVKRKINIVNYNDCDTNAIPIVEHVALKCTTPSVSVTFKEKIVSLLRNTKDKLKKMMKMITFI